MPRYDVRRSGTTRRFQVKLSRDNHSISCLVTVPEPGLKEVRTDKAWETMALQIAKGLAKQLHEEIAA